MASPSQPPVPTASPVERIQRAYADRAQTDYVFSFWTALGWTILTCGIYGFYVTYQIVRRSRDHNRRRLELLDAATAAAWDRAQASGRADELRPRFESMGVHLGVLRNMTTNFRDPVIWTILRLLGTIVDIILFILLDGDLVKHDSAERAAETELAGIYSALGADLTVAPPGEPHQANNYVARVLVVIVTIGIYFLWWTYNIMDDLN